MKTAIYTCITGGYESVKKPLFIEDNCDYYFISEDKSGLSEPYKWVDVNRIVPDCNISNKDKNRYCKLHPFDIFPQYDYTIYVDGSIQIVGRISHNIEKVGNLGIAMHRHRCSDDVYEEGIFLDWLGVACKKNICEDINRYAKAGLPRHFGMFECGMIVTDLHNSIAQKIYNCWYEEYLASAGRDQQAFMYVLWTMGYKPEYIGDLGGKYDISTNPEIRWDRSGHYKNCM